jgi:hypothetical protein
MAGFKFVKLSEDAFAAYNEDTTHEQGADLIYGATMQWPVTSITRIPAVESGHKY